MIFPVKKGEHDYGCTPLTLEDVSYPATEVGILDNDSIFSDSLNLDMAEKTGSPFHTPATNDDLHELSNSSSELESPLLQDQQVSFAPKPRKIPLKLPDGWEPLGMTIPSNDPEDEFDIGTALKPVFHKNTDDESEITFQNSEPDMKGEVVSCFDEPGLLYRIIDRRKKIWAFYNDSLNFNVHVSCTFGKHSKLEAMDNTVLRHEEDGSIVAEVIVSPCETELFVKGLVNGFTSRLRALPIPDEYFEERCALQHKSVVEGEIQRVKDIVGNETDARKVLEACMSSSVPFVDLEFPPVQSSIDMGAGRSLRILPWFRPRMYLRPGLEQQVRLFRKPIRPGGVQQGELGDCWIMCAIATLSERPEEVMRMFYHPRGAATARAERLVGAYCVTLNINGLWKTVIVDDYFPAIAGTLKFARSSDPCELWPAVLEKAYAKVHNGYGAVQSGDPVHVLTDMTGCPSSRFDDAFADAQVNGGDELFQQLLEQHQAGYQILLTTAGKAPAFISGTNKYAGVFAENPELEKVLSGTSLVPGHAYTLCAVHHFPSNQNVRLVKIRNVWGSPEEWNGPWSANSTEWSMYPAVAEACKVDMDDDNDSSAIWMDWAYVLKCFNGGGVHYLDHAYDYRIPLNFFDSRPSLVLEVHVESPVWVTFILSNVNYRSVCNDSDVSNENINDDTEDGNEYPPLMISLSSPHDSEGREHKVVQNSSLDISRPSSDRWTFMQAREISMMCKLTPEQSPYLVIPRMMEIGDMTEHSAAWFTRLQEKISPLHFVNRHKEVESCEKETEVPVVLGVRCAHSIGDEGDGGVRINFKHLDYGNVVFDNFPRFPAETTTVNNVYYQVKPPAQGFVEEKVGSSLF